MFNIGFAELIMILLIAFVVVGPKDLPKVARALGRTVRKIKKMFDEFKDETSLDETIKEFKGIERDVKTTMKDADPRKDIQDIKNDTERTLRDAQAAAEGSESTAKQ